jgi:hypothetical protein
MRKGISKSGRNVKEQIDWSDVIRKIYSFKGVVKIEAVTNYFHCLALMFSIELLIFSIKYAYEGIVKFTMNEFCFMAI